MSRTLLLLCLLTPTMLNAQSVLIVSLINNSSSKFVFERSSVEFPGNTLSVDTKVLLPHDVATVIGTTTLDQDLSGVIYFSGNASFWIVDKRQVHIGPPIFAFFANATISSVISKTPNPNLGARLLSYIAAKVLIQDS